MYATASAALADHWIDLVLSALLAVIGYLLDARLRGIDERLEKMEEEIAAARADVAHNAERLAKVEALCHIL